MYRFPIFYVALSSHKNHCWPWFKFIFIRFIYFLCIIYFIKFLNYLVVLTKKQKKSPIKIFTMLFSYLNLSGYSTNDFFFCFLVFTILERDCASDRYGYVACTRLLIEWVNENIVFKGPLRILYYLGFSLILFFVWVWQNSLNIIT